MARLVLTWLSTAAGGAEHSVGELAGALAAAGHEVVLVWWDAARTGTGALADHRIVVHRVEDLPGYRQAVRDALEVGTRVVMICTHRTMLVDVPMARCHAVSVIVVMRALLLAGGRFVFWTR